MPQAWQVREYQQKEFVGQIAQEVNDWAEKTGKYDQSMLIFAHAFFQFLAEIPTYGGLRVQECSEMLKQLDRRIRSFIRVKSERPQLFFLLFRELEPSILSPLTRSYLRDQIHNPQGVYGSPSATTEVKLSSPET